MGQPMRAQEATQRQFVDREGRVWRVVEREVPVPGRSLYFESDAGWRRVRRYPSDWRVLSSEQLDQLSNLR